LHPIKHPPKILVIEDNQSDVFLLRWALTSLGEEFELEIVCDGERAIQMVQAERERQHDARPCVILLDLHLPRHDGLEVLRAIRQEPDMSHIHVLVMTTSVSPQQHSELREMGVPYRLKPKDISECQDLAAEVIALCKGQISRTSAV